MNAHPQSIIGQKILDTQHFGRLSCSFAEQPYIIPITYVYHEGYIYGQTDEGTKLEIIRLNKNVCFEVSRVTGPGTWESVVVSGIFEELTDSAAVAARNIFMEKAFPIKETYPSSDTLLKDFTFSEYIKRMREVIYRIRVEHSCVYHSCNQLFLNLTDQNTSCHGKDIRHKKDKTI